MNTSYQKINLREKRDFGEIINTTFAFLKQNFKPLFKGVLFIGGPAILIGFIFSGSAIHGLTDFGEHPDSDVAPGAFWKLGLGYFFLIVGMVFFYAVVLNYFKLYLDSDDENQEITVTQLWQATKAKILSLIGLSFLVMIMITIGMFLFIIPGIYLAFALSFTGVVLVIEDKGVFDSIARSFTVIGGHWWSTFGLLFVVSIITSVVSYAFLIPLYIILGIFGLSNAQDPASNLDTIISVYQIIMLIYMPLYYLVVVMLTSVSISALVLKYFSIVEEKESVGTMQEIENLGTGGSAE